MGLKKLVILLILSALILGLSGSVWAEPKTNIVIKTVLASQDSDFVDPRLSDLIKDLQSVFRYSSYKLLGQDRMILGIGETGLASLPENRILKITPTGTRGDRVSLQLEILKNRRQVFQTVIQLLNHASITVGGPEYRGGYLLFNIFSSFLKLEPCFSNFFFKDLCKFIYRNYSLLYMFCKCKVEYHEAPYKVSHCKCRSV